MSPTEHPTRGHGLLRSSIGGAEVREHPALLLLYLLSWATPLLLWPKPPVAATIAGWLGAAALALLILRLVLVGYTGYERFVGLRIIHRQPTPPVKGQAPKPVWQRGRFWLAVLGSTAALGMATLLGLNHFLDRNDGAVLGLLQPLRVSLIFYVALASFAGLLVLIGRRFSVFGTTSIIGVTLGVAALLVIQSVSSGFQHEFERRVVGVYAHMNVTQNLGFGMSEHRRVEAWLRTLDGVEGASPFVYHAMAIAPHRLGDDPRDSRPASVLVKGIDPRTAAQVIDLPEHLVQGSGRAIPLTELHSEYDLMPVPDRSDDQLPAVIAATPDPRGDDWYEIAITAWNATPHDDPFQSGYAHLPESEDVWEDPPELGTKHPVAELDRSGMPSMFIGVGLARELQLAEGDIVRLVDPASGFDETQQPQFVHYEIAGVFEAGFQEYDLRLVYVDIKELQRFKYRGKDLVSGVDLRLTDPDSAPEVGAAIREALNDPELPDKAQQYKVLEWQKLNESLFSSIRSQRNIVMVILSLVIFVAGFNVLSALWTMVVRRTADIAIIMSMGATGPQIARIFQVTGMAIGLIGSLAGVALGLLMCWLVEIYGFTLDPDVYVIAQLPVEVDPALVAWILALALVICFIATLPPSLRAARLRPLTGLKS